MKKRIVICAACAAALCIVAWLWRTLASPTRIAFVNWQAITLGQISRANDNPFVKLEELSADNLGRAGRYDMVFVNGMGLRITEEQRQALLGAAQAGTPVITSAATNPQNHIISVDSVDNEFLRRYLVGGSVNYRNMLRYVRRFIDGKRIFADMPGDPVSISSSLLFYPSAGDDLRFGSVAGYEEWMKRAGKWREDAPRVILTGQMGVFDSLVSRLEAAGCMVYPAAVIQPFIAKGHADSVGASAVINLAHGRLGDNVVRWLEEQNIPLFAPLNANRSYDEWMADNMGMSGGFLSQSVVTPEIDGAIRPFTLFAHFAGKDGLPHVEAIPDRLDEFVECVCRHISLQRKPEKEKRVAVFYFKGAGQNALVAEGMEVVPSLYNLLLRLKAEGYRVDNLPADAAAFGEMIERYGRVFNMYAEGAKESFVRECNPEIIPREEYDRWCEASLSADMRRQTDAVDGPFPGHGLSDDEGRLALARLQFGNIVLIPQTAAGLGDDDFRMVHGTDAAPPHNYVAAYLWARYGFKADALMHFGAHGSLEFTPRKQAALGSEDWPDRLVGPLPHIYVYSTSNVGEAMTAKRRAYAVIVNHLTPPFMESGMRSICKNLSEAVAEFNRADGSAESLRAAERVKRHALELGIHRELRIDSLKPLSAEDVSRIESFADELVNARVTGALYVMGEPYSEHHIRTTVEAMTVDPIAYSLRRLRGGDVGRYREQARRLVASGGVADDDAICRIAGLSRADLDSARRIRMSLDGSRDMLSRMMVMGSMMSAAEQPAVKISERPATKRRRGLLPAMSPEKALEMARRMGADEESLKKMEAAMKRKQTALQAGESPAAANPEFTGEEVEFALAVGDVERTLRNIEVYREALRRSPECELAAVVNALDGGFVNPSSGGDPVLNPDILPTGRNMFAVDAEQTPSAAAWEKGRALAEATVAMYRKAHGDSIPRKVSYTLWSSEFIETEGATVAQVLFMLGVEPVRDPFGRVTDLRLIPSEELGRPRIDVVVQTSGQLRDLAASRLFLISRAVRMAAEAVDDKFPNYVAEGVVETERRLVDRGVSPKEARSLAASRVFGGVGGNYGSGIQSMVEAGDRWESGEEIAAVYIGNMGASYGSEAEWEQMREYLFEAALTRTDVVVQPRQSNTWGALSLDHVYEFMGGLNLAVRSVTGKEPEAYLSDYRNRSRVRMQEIKEAVGIESRTTILNPAYIRERMNGGAGDAASFADIVRNTYGWNVMKPEAIDNELWNDIYDTYIADKNGLGIKDYFRNSNPAALQEMTAVMLETVRKGMWHASDEQVARMAELHAETVKEFGAACSGFVCDNSKLREFISSKVSPSAAEGYNRAVAKVRAESIAAGDGVVMKREELGRTETVVNRVDGLAVAAAALAAFVGLAVWVRARRKKSVE